MCSLPKCGTHLFLPTLLPPASVGETTEEAAVLLVPSLSLTSSRSSNSEFMASDESLTKTINLWVVKKV